MRVKYYDETGRKVEAQTKWVDFWSELDRTIAFTVGEEMLQIDFDDVVSIEDDDYKEEEV